MSKALKWILGIGIALVVVAVIAGIAFLVFSRFNGFNVMMGARQARPFGDGRLMPWRNMPMNPYFGMPGGRLGGFFPLRMIAGWVFSLGILALIVLGIIALAAAFRRSSQPSAAPAQAVSAVAVTPPSPANPPAVDESPARTCPSCGRPANADWSHCPYCGSPLT